MTTTPKNREVGFGILGTGMVAYYQRQGWGRAAGRWSDALRMKVGLQVGQAGNFRKDFALAGYRAVSPGSQEAP